MMGQICNQHGGAHLVGEGGVGRARGWGQPGGIRPHPCHGYQVEHQQLTHRPPRRVLTTEYVHTTAHQRRLRIAAGTVHSTTMFTGRAALNGAHTCHLEAREKCLGQMRCFKAAYLEQKHAIHCHWDVLPDFLLATRMGLASLWSLAQLTSRAKACTTLKSNHLHRHDAMCRANKQSIMMLVDVTNRYLKCNQPFASNHSKCMSAYRVTASAGGWCTRWLHHCPYCGLCVKRADLHFFPGVLCLQQHKHTQHFRVLLHSSCTCSSQ